MLDHELRFSFFNKMWLDYRGKLLWEELENTPSHFIHKDDLPKFLNGLENAVDRLEPYSAEFRLLKSTGEYRWFNAVLVPHYNQDGTLRAFIGYCIDSNEKHIADENMRRLAAIISNADAGIVLKNREGIILDWNVGAQNMLGYGPEEIIGKTTLEYSPIEGIEDVNDINARVFRGEHIPLCEVVRKHKNGYPVYCSASFTPVFGSGGEVTGSVTIFHDITMQKQAENKARSLAAIVAIADAGIILKDRDGVIQDWNVGAQNILGYKAEEIIGKTTKNYAPSEGAAEIDEINARLMKGEHIAHREVVREHKDGRRIDCSASYTPILDDKSEIIGSVSIFHDISEKKRIEKEHKALEDTLTNIFDNLANAFCLYEIAYKPDETQDLRIVMANKAYADFVGQPLETLPGRLFSEVCAGDIEWLPSYLMVANSGVGRSFERYSYFFKKHVNGVLYSPMSGQVALAMIDRTHIVEAQRALKARENDLTQLFSSMSTGFCLGKIIYDQYGQPADIIFEMVNEAFELLEGYKAADIVGRPLFEGNPEADRTFLPVYADVAANQSKASFIKYIPTTQKTLEVVCYSPNEGYFACVENDTSQRIKTERELKKSYTDTRAILDEIPAPICVAAKNSGLVLGCNAAFIRMCRADSERDIVGLPLSAYLHMSEGMELGEAFRQLDRGVSFNCNMKRLDGLVIEIDVFARPFIYDNQEAFAVHCLDLTRQKAHEQALLDAARVAEEASEMKTSFLANMSHEIRTPMNGVIGLAELALDEDGLSDRMRDYLVKIKNSAVGLLNIINDILDISKIEAGKVVLEKIPFSLHEVFKECEEISGIKAEEKDITLFFYAEPEISKKLLGDPTKLRQILLNLLSNAIKFTNNGIVKLLSLATQEPEGHYKIHFEVKDSGIGLTSEQIAKIFDPFTQADNSTTRKHGGTGLGLSITKNLIELMGGELEVESLPSLGSKFSFDLFFEAADVPDMSELQCGTALPESRKPLFSGSALVCEDNAINQQVIKEHLRKVGFEVTLAENGRKGVEAARSRQDQGQPFDIIMMDIHMPEMDGLEASQHLREIGNKAPVVAITANAMAKDREVFLNSGMSGYLCKPFKSQELWDILQQFITPIGFSCPVSHEKPPEQQVKSAIDRDVGIERAADDEALYAKLQADFYSDNQDTFKKLEELLKSGDTKSAHRLVHTLKSVAGTIGAIRLSAAAQSVEHSLSENSPGLDAGELRALKAALEEVVDELAPRFRENAGPIGNNGQLNKEKAAELVCRLKPLLKNGNSKSLDYLDEIRDIISPAGEICSVLMRNIEDYEFESALDNISDFEKILEA